MHEIQAANRTVCVDAWSDCSTTALYLGHRFNLKQILSAARVRHRSRVITHIIQRYDERSIPYSTDFILVSDFVCIVVLLTGPYG